MTSYVSLQVETVLKALATLHAAVRRFAVNHQVTSEVIITSKALFTLRTTVQLFTSVYQCVTVQVCPLPEPFVTQCTDKRLLSAVGFLMTVQVSLRHKPFVTHGTQIRSWLVVKSVFDDIFVFHLKWFGHINDISFSIHLTAGRCVHTRDSRIIDK